VLAQAQALDLERQLDVLDQVAPGQEVGVLEHHADLRVRLVHGLAIEQDAAAGQLVQAGHRPEQGGLAAAGRPEHADQLAVPDLHRVVLERVDRAGPGPVVLGRALDHELDRRRRVIAAVSQPRPHGSLGPARRHARARGTLGEAWHSVKGGGRRDSG
jgi:hypothetical protein